MPSFRKLVQDALSAAGFKSELDGDEHLKVVVDGDATGKLNLANFLEYHRHGMSIDDVIQRIVGAITLVTKGRAEFDWDRDSDKLRVHIISKDALPPGAFSRDVSPLLCETLIIDEPEHILYVTKNDVESSGRDIEAFWFAAEFNMTAHAPEPETIETSTGETVYVWRNSMGADYAWHWARRQPEAAVALPVRDFGFAMSSVLEEDLLNMAVAAVTCPAPNIHPITTVVHVMRQGKAVGLFEAYPASDTAPH